MPRFRGALLPTAATALSLGATPAALADGLSFTNYTTSNGLGENRVYGVYASGSNIYAATYNRLSISTNSGANWTNYSTSNGLGNNLVYGVYTSGSNIYAATNGGGLSISTNNGTSWSNYTTANGLANNTVYAVYARGGKVYAVLQATSASLSFLLHLLHRLQAPCPCSVPPAPSASPANCAADCGQRPAPPADPLRPDPS